MRILIVLTYYRPHTSGLTIYVERQAKALTERGHQVTVLTSQFEKNLPREEVQDGVRIVRVPVLARVSKGVLMPSFGYWASRLALKNDVIHLHLPQFDAAGVALRGRLLRKPTVITYHCDLLMPPGLLSQLANRLVHVMNHLSGKFAHRIVTYTQDYADHSPYLQRYQEKLRIIQPPVVLPKASRVQIKDFSQAHDLENRRPVIGMAARFAAEKGVEVLLDALPDVLDQYPQAVVLFAGPYQNLVGEEAYARRLFPRIQAYERQGNRKFLGVLSPAEMAAFYPNLDVLVIPSLNSTEAFGLVQIEAMLNGTPCVASALPGVRQPVLTTGMGKVVPIGDSAGLSEALFEIFGEPHRFKRPADPIARHYAPASVATAYENLYTDLLVELGRPIPKSQLASEEWQKEPMRGKQEG